MMYKEFKVGAKELKLKLRSQDTVKLERALGKNPLTVVMAASKEELPKLEDILCILHHSLQAFEHGYTLEKTYELFDEYVDNGGSMIDLIPIVLEVFQTSGLIPKEEPKKPKRKN